MSDHCCQPPTDAERCAILAAPFDTLERLEFEAILARTEQRHLDELRAWRKLNPYSSATGPEPCANQSAISCLSVAAIKAR